MSKEYYQAEGINASTLKYFGGKDFNPCLALHKMRNPMQPSQSMALGTAVHSILEHEMNTDEAEEVLAEAYKTEKARAPVFQKAFTMASNIWNECGDIVQSPYAIREKAHFKDGYKALIDLEVDKIGYDYKTTRVASIEECKYEANKWLLEIQAYHYQMIADFKGFCFIFVSSVEPHQVFTLWCTEEYLEGFAKPRWEEALERYHLFKDANIPLKTSDELHIPHWYESKAEDVFK